MNHRAKKKGRFTTNKIKKASLVKIIRIIETFVNMQNVKKVKGKGFPEATVRVMRRC
jgi:hypothetical protein